MDYIVPTIHVKISFPDFFRFLYSSYYFLHVQLERNGQGCSAKVSYYKRAVRIYTNSHQILIKTGMNHAPE
jgi:hypothetical protein